MKNGEQRTLAAQYEVDLDAVALRLTPRRLATAKQKAAAAKAAAPVSAAKQTRARWLGQEEQMIEQLNGLLAGNARLREVLVERGMIPPSKAAVPGFNS
jgi:hypothetical protein